MRSRLFAATLALAGSLLLPPPAAAQERSPWIASYSHRLAVPTNALAGSHPAAIRLVLPDSVVTKGKDHTVTGLLIGAGVGVVAGWAFYDVICEAVDNHCSSSRLPYLVFGGAGGAALGAAIGSSVD